MPGNQEDSVDEDSVNNYNRNYVQDRFKVLRYIYQKKFLKDTFFLLFLVHFNNEYHFIFFSSSWIFAFVFILMAKLMNLITNKQILNE